VVVDREHRCLMANRGFLKRRNLTSEQVVGRFVHEFVEKDVYEAVIKPKLDECFRGNIVRYELKYTYPYVGERDLFASYYPIEGNNGVDRAACILHDITERKRAEQALADMARKLIAAQEQERARIARELHDDINQQLALLAIELQRLRDDPTEARSRLQKLFDQINAISSDVEALAHELHSSKLEYLGAVAAMKSWCMEFSEWQKVYIDFQSSVSRILPLEVGLPLFRVLQEALHNAAKHSGAKRIEVRLSEPSNEVRLTIRDSGTGFDVAGALGGAGLGLTSMRERVRLVNGTIKIESKPMHGTTIHVRVPLGSEQNSLSEAV
jgi:PAS domain S-box-containing protein